MGLKMTVKLSGLIAYVRGQSGGAKTIKTIDALLLASVPHKGGAHHPADSHAAYLVLPTTAIHTASTPDFVMSAGADEYALWRIEHREVEVLVDGKAPTRSTVYSIATNGHTPTKANESSLGWLPSLSKAADMALDFRPDCLPPHLDTTRVTGAVRLRGGVAKAYWALPDHKKEVWTFHLHEDLHELPVPRKLEPYEQALADGLIWTFEAVTHVEFVLRSTCGAPSKSVHVTVGKEEQDDRHVDVTISNKTGTLDGQSIFSSDIDAASHFAMFYDLVDPSPGETSRRLPVKQTTLTKTVRCPGSSA